MPTLRSCQHIDNPNRFTVLPEKQISRVQAAYGLIQNTMSQILMIRLIDSGLFFFPGGKREPEEDLEQALIREVYEETQQIVIQSTVQFELRQESYLFHPQKNLGFFCEANYYSCQIQDIGNPLASSHEGEALWVNQQEIQNQLSVNADFILLKWQLNLFKRRYNAGQK